jgi:hypothetical protein
VRILACVEHVERATVAPLHGVLEGGLEAAADVDDEVGAPNRLDVARGELHVVRLDARWREVHHLVDQAARDLLGCPRERVKGRHDGSLRCRALAGAADGQKRDYDENDRAHR